MKKNWKYLATTKGYKSLKAAYINTVKRKNSFENKEELYKRFQNIIGKAKHYSFKTGKSIETILDDWEDKRDYSWKNYYNNIPLLHSNCLKSSGIKGIKKNYKTHGFFDKQYAKHRVCRYIQEQHKKQSKKIKERWPSDYKKRMARYRVCKSIA